MDAAYVRGIEKLVSVVQELSLARTVLAVQTTVKHAARELTGADGATVIMREGDLCFYADEDAIAPLWKGHRFPMDRCISGWVMKHARATFIEDIYVDERIPVEAYRPTFVKSLAVVPIRTRDPIGAIGNYWATQHLPTDNEMRLLQALADSASIALENVQLFAQLEARIVERSEALEATRRAEAAARHELAERLRTEEALARTEAQLRQAQKMEAVGQLAGGIAHDFNNMLSVILSYSAIVALDLESGRAAVEDVDEIRKAGDRAAALTRQLLAFSRQQVLEPRLLDVGEVTAGMMKMLERLIGENMRLESSFAPALHPIFADPGQIEQVLMNLAVNARDAMPTGGKLTIEASNVVLDGDYMRDHLGVEPGQYVLLAVSDTGVGMDKATQERIFEPFFTTKEKGRGTGLGLSTVYGIVKQSGGHVWVYSELNRGTTFKVYLPLAKDRVAVEHSPAPPVTDLRGSETVLVVEDDEQVRAVAKDILTRFGYRVHEAKNAAEVFTLVRRPELQIDLLLTDMIMPDISGTELARQVTELRPELRVLCMSGYTDAAALRHGMIDSVRAYVQKPFTPESLLAKVRQVLDTSSAD